TAVISRIPFSSTRRFFVRLAQEIRRAAGEERNSYILHRCLYRDLHLVAAHLPKGERDGGSKTENPPGKNYKNGGEEDPTFRAFSRPKSFSRSLPPAAPQPVPVVFPRRRRAEFGSTIPRREPCPSSRKHQPFSPEKCVSKNQSACSSMTMRSSSRA